MRFSRYILAVAILSALQPLPATATTCGTAEVPAMIARLEAAGHAPVVVSGIPLARSPSRGGQVTDVTPLGPGMFTRTITYRILGRLTMSGGWTTAALVETTLDVVCEQGYCGDLPDPFEPRTFLLWESDDGLIGYGGLCGFSIRPYATPAQNAAIRRCLAWHDCGQAVPDHSGS